MSRRMQGASSSKRGRTKHKSHRVDATDLFYQPTYWVDHLRKIKAHFGATMLKYLLSRQIGSPNFNRDLSYELLDDESRNLADRPAFPPIANVHYRFWHHNTADTLDAFLAECTNVEFLSFRDAAIAAHGNVDVEAEEEEAEGEDAQAAYEPSHAELAGLAHASIVNWYQQTVAWRGGNPSDPHKLQKLTDLLTKAGNHANYLPRWVQLPIHLKTYVFDQLNTTLYGFFQTYVGTKAYRYIIEQSIDNDGLSVLTNLEHGRILPSSLSGQTYMVKITQIVQPPGTSWNAYRSIIQELQDDYFQAAGTTLPSELVYLALTNRLQYFYQPVVNLLDQREKMGHPQLPLTLASCDPALHNEKMSVQKLMCKHEVQHPEKFRKYLSKKRRSQRPNQRVASAHNAMEHRGPKKGANRHKSNKPSGPKEFNCAWCKRHRPGKPTSHTERDCRIKADHRETTCDICHGKGHPAKFCPNTKGHAHRAEESKVSHSNKPNKGRRNNRGRPNKPNRYLTSQGLAAHDELNAAEALKAIKCAHDQLKHRGVKGARFKITMLDQDHS